MMNSLAKHTSSILIPFIGIGILALGAGLIHGSIKGMKMPGEAATSLPRIEKPQTEETADNPVSSSTDTTEGTEAESNSDSAFPVEVLHDYWMSGLATLIDARSEEEFAEGRIPMAVHLPLEGFDGGVPDSVMALPTDSLLIVYCGGGDCHASNAVGSMLIEFGYENVVIFEDGFQAWEAAGYEVERSQ